MKKITKKDIVREIADAHDTNQTVVRASIDAFLDAIAQAATNGTEVSIPGFGKFKRRDMPARKGRNPATGESIDIAASSTLTFKCAQQMKNRLN
ncbi:HU family DNA-binding protein [Ruegeria arenilitoris]|uniref:HU family DNA-binding protein n=1 Tax=Ruegeria arenilitoris TaxID=1173585 RepID=UPI00147EDDA8|nr:HU family DNA-binding protein [Ruegeria arenilitoris]